MFKKELDREIIEEKLENGSVKKYVKGRTLGKGGFAKCFEFMSEETGKRYAAKVIEKDTLIKAKAKEKLQSEIKIHKELKHKYIVRFEHYFEDHEFVYILLEVCPNQVPKMCLQTLNEMLKRRKRLTQLEVKYYIYQIAQAVKYIHCEKIIHRDLKLGNLFLSEHLEIKVGDFGLATNISYQGEKKKTVCGTPNYIAPEILDNKKGHSYEVDIWSLGVIAYALLFGKPPFETNEVDTTYLKIKSCSFAFPTQASEQAKNFISKMLKLDPSQRATIDEILQDQFLNKMQIPNTLPRSTLACPPSMNFIEQVKKQNILAKEENIKIIAEENRKNKIQEFQFALNLSRGSKSSISKKQIDQLNNFDSKNKLNNVESKGKLNNIERKTKQGSIEKGKAEKDARGIQMKGLMVHRSKSSAGLMGSKKYSIQILPNQAVGPSRWVIFFEENKKFGLCYLLNNSEVGIRFNDTSCLLANQKLNKFKYILLDSQSNQTTIETFDTNYPEKLQKKMKIIVHFSKQFKNKEIIKHENHFASNTSERNGLKSEISVFIKRYCCFENTHMFWLSNKNIQAIFQDSSQIIISSNYSVYVHKNRERKMFKTDHLNQQSEEIKSRVAQINTIIKKIIQSAKKVDQVKAEKIEKLEKENMQMMRASSTSKINVGKWKQDEMKNVVSSKRLLLQRQDRPLSQFPNRK